MRKSTSWNQANGSMPDRPHQMTGSRIVSFRLRILALRTLRGGSHPGHRFYAVNYN